MKIIFTLLPLLIHAQYRIEELTNPLLPVYQGTSYIITNYHHVYYHVNLTNIKNCVELTKTTLLQVNQTLRNSSIISPYLPIHELLIVRTHNLIDQLEVIELFINHYTTPQKRTKRGLFNLLGKAQKYLYGTLDADDGERYDDYIRTLQENQRTLQQDISSTQTIVKKLTEDIDKQLNNVKSNQLTLLTRVNDLMTVTQSATTASYFILLLDNLENNLRVINEICNNVQTAINFAEINIMHHSIFKYQELRAIISKLDPNSRIPFDNIIKYYEVAHADVTIKNNLIIFYVAIPLISNKPYILYRIYPIPLNNQIAIIKNPYLMKSSDNFFNIKENCFRIEDISLCPIKLLNQNEPCVNQAINLTNHCSMTPVKYQETSVTQLDDNSIIIIPTSKESASFQCPTQQSVEIISQVSLILPSECKVKIQGKNYDSQKSEIINLRLKLPSISIDEKLIQNIEPLELKEINLETIREDLENAQRLAIHPLKEFDIRNSSLSITLIIIIIIVFIIIIIYVYRRYYCKKHKENVQVDIKLEPFENQPRFSQT